MAVRKLRTGAFAALKEGVTSFESSFGELSGCPLPGLDRNIASTDLVSIWHEMGIETGVDLGRLLEASAAYGPCLDACSVRTR